MDEQSDYTSDAADQPEDEIGPVDAYGRFRPHTHKRDVGSPDPMDTDRNASRAVGVGNLVDRAWNGVVDYAERAVASMEGVFHVVNEHGGIAVVPIMGGIAMFGARLDQNDGIRRARAGIPARAVAGAVQAAAGGGMHRLNAAWDAFLDADYSHLVADGGLVVDGNTPHYYPTFEELDAM